MSKSIEVPENIIGLAKKILEDSGCYGDNSLELANFITSATRTEIEVEPFVVYRIEVNGNNRIGFKFPTPEAYNQWVVVGITTFNRDDAVPTYSTAGLAHDNDVKVIERWTPEAPEIKFGITADDAVTGAEVLVRGSLAIDGVDSDDDVFVTATYSDGLSSDVYVNAADVALLRGGL